MTALAPLPPSRGGMPGPRASRPGESQLAPAIEVTRLLRALRRRWWIPLLAALMVGAGAWGYLRARPVRWFGTAVVQLYEARRALTAGIATPDPIMATGGEVAVMSQVSIVTSRAVLGAVLDSVPLGFRVVLPGVPARDVRAGLPGREEAGRTALAFSAAGWRVARDSAAPWTPWGATGVAGGVALAIARRPGDADGATLVVRGREAAIDLLATALVVKPRDKTALLDIRVVADDPTLAVTLTNALALEYQRTDARVAQQQVRRRRDFIESQLREVSAQLARAERAQSDFRGRTQAYSSAEKFAGKRTELAALDARRAELDAERRLGTDLLARLEQGDARALRMLPSTPLGGTASVSALYAQLVQREAARLEAVSGPRGLATTSPEVQRLDTLVATTRAQLVGAVQAHLEVLGARLAALDEQRARGELALRAVPDAQAEETQLATGVQVLREQATQLRAEYQKARIAEAASPGQVEIIDPATRAAPLVTPIGRVLVFAAVLGLVLGVGGVLLLESLDGSVRTRDDLEGALQLRVLGTVPRIVPPRRPGRRAPGALVPRGTPRATRRDVARAVAHDLRSASAEAFRQLRTNLLYAAAQQPVRTLMVTSAREDEGKTSVAVSLAISFAQQRLRVLLVDCDLLKSRLSAIFELPADGPGLRQVLLEGADPRAVVQPTRIPGVSVVGPGHAGTDAVDVAGSARLQVVLAALAGDHDVVIVDSAPILAVADSLAVGVATDGVLVVACVGRTRREEAAEAVRSLDAVGARVIGAVLNDPDDRLRQYGGVAYAYGYAYAGGAR